MAVSINFVGGAYAFEPGGEAGLAAVTAQMLSEGTATRTASRTSRARMSRGKSGGTDLAAVEKAA